MAASTPSTLTRTVFDREWTLIQLLESMDHAFSLWDSALHFVRFLETNPKDLQKLRGKRVLEVGTGTGLVAMVLADVAGCTVVATDLPHVMPNLVACLRANGFGPRGDGAYARIGGEGGQVTPAPYGWGADVTDLLHAHGPFDYVIGTDVVYSEYLVPALLRSIATVALASEGRLGDLVLAAPGGRPAARACVAFLANEIRCTATHELFCATAERYFRVKQLKKSRYHADSRDTSLHIFELRVRTDGHVSLSSGAPAPLMDLPGEVSYQLCVPFPPLVASAAAGGASASGATPCSEDFRSRVLVDSELDTLAAGDASAPAGSPSALLPQELRTASDPGSALLAAGPTSASLSEALATLALPMAAAVLCDALASASASDGSHGHGLFSQPPCEPPHVCATDSAASAGVTGSGSGSASGAEHRSLRDDIGSTSRSAGRIGARNPMHMRAAGLDRTMP